jgi:tetratricopeptide (TPR) repeat protein
MKNFCLVVGLFLPVCAWAQLVNTKRVVTPVIQERAIYLNGGARATVGGTSRETIRVDLPPNTVSWYYSFTTAPGESGVANLKLAAQLGVLALDQTGLTRTALETISVPNGSASIDVCVLDQDNADLFMRKVDLSGGTYYYQRDGSILNTRSGLIQINTIKEGTVYLGLKNPSMWDGININLEVVALTEEIEPMSEQESEAITLGNLGWKAFERGDYDRCLELSRKAIAMDETLGFIHFNIGITLLMKGLNDDALQAYAKAMAVTKRSSVSAQTFEGAVADLRNYMTKFPSQADAKDILEILIDEIKR